MRAVGIRHEHLETLGHAGRECFRARPAMVCTLTSSRLLSVPGDFEAQLQQRRPGGGGAGPQPQVSLHGQADRLKMILSLA